MARTKKYLSSSRKSRSFYRPITRTAHLTSPTSQSKDIELEVFSSSSQQQIKSHSVQSEIEHLEQQIAKAQQLRSDLEKKISTPQKTDFIKIDDKNTDNEDFCQPEQASIIPNSNNTDYLFDLSPVYENKADDNAKIDDSDENQDSTTRSDSEEDSDLNFTDHDMEENISLMENGLSNSLKKDEYFKKELKEIKQVFDEEKENLQKQLRSLKKEVNHVTPIRENKFFTISKQLEEVTLAMNQLIQSDDFNETNNSVPDSKNQNITQNSNIQPINNAVANPTPIPNPISPITNNHSQNQAPESDKTEIRETNKTPIPADEIKNTDKSDEKPKKKRVPKAVKILGTTFFIVAIICGVIFYQFNKKTEVSQELLQQYLPKESQEQIQNQDLEKKINESSNSSNQSITSKPETKGASDQKYAESQADVGFKDTVWDIVKDPSFGIEISYPKNTANFIKTESSITFLRKSGYIFKIQLIETALNEKEYWKSVKATSLDYKIKETTFRDYPALFLELEDTSKYPGDKYLVKKGDFIYDIWYATFSDTLSDDDAKRTDIMLNSFKFLE